MAKILKELFDNEAFDKLLKWADSSMNYDEKADKIDKLMKKYEFKQFASGTNRKVYIHKDYPKVVFKIGFDPQGIVDNLNEYHKSSLSDYFASSFELDDEGLVLVQERCPTISYDEFNKKENRKRVRKLLENLDDEGFILLDLGLDKHLNYGVDKKGRFRIIDYGYVELKSLGNFNCPHVRYKSDDKKKPCKGKLHYNKDFTKLECDECENVFKIDVVLEGYTETKYQSTEKLPKYKPSKELDAFYKNFNKHRDRATLKQFVALSNKSDINKEGEVELDRQTMLDKMKKLSGGGVSSNGSENFSVPQVNHVEPERASRAEEILPASQRKPLSVYHSTPRGIDVLKPDEEVELEKKRIDDLAAAFELLYNEKSELSDKFVRDLFYARFPEVANAVQELKERLIADEQGEDEPNEVLTLCDESSIEICKGTNKDHELHILFQVENLKRDPWIIMSKGDTVVHIDLKAHMDKIIQIDHDDETELVVSEMITEPLSDFDWDYEDAYFGDDNEDTSEED